MGTEFTVLYFSGTGNSRYTAKRLSSALGCECIDIGFKIKNSSFEPVFVSKNCVIVVPIYFWRLPEAVEEFLLKVRLVGVSNLWYVMTYASEFGNCDKYNKKLSEKLNCNHMGTSGVVMPCNHVTMVDVPDDNSKAYKLSIADDIIESVINDLKGGIAFNMSEPSLVDIAKSDFNPVVCKAMITEKPFWVSDKCIGCGKCADLCQFNNIILKDRKPHWGEKCTHCLACINLCPVRAIEYGKSTADRGRYHLD